MNRKIKCRKYQLDGHGSSMSSSQRINKTNPFKTAHTIKEHSAASTSSLGSAEARHLF